MVLVWCFCGAFVFGGGGFGRGMMALRLFWRRVFLWWIFGFSRWGARAGSEVLMKSSLVLRCALVNGFVTFHVFEIGRGYSDG